MQQESIAGNVFGRASRAALVAGVALAGLVGLAGEAAAQSSPAGQYVLVRQDGSDCGNTSVSAADASRITGDINISVSGGVAAATVRITRGTAFTSYNVYWKCVTQLGVVVTDESGVGTGTFFFTPPPPGIQMAFDVYPDGAPSGNVFQSTLAPAVQYYLVRQDQSDCSNSDVSGADRSRIVGGISVARSYGNVLVATISIMRGTPFTTYDVFWKCVTGIGQVTTDANGFGRAVVNFSAAPDAFLAFDVYPAGAPPGNKFQSTRAP